MTVAVDRTTPATDDIAGLSAPVTADRATGVTPHTSGKDTDSAAKALLALLADLPADSPDRPRVRGRLIEMYVPLAEYLARRFRNRGEPRGARRARPPSRYGPGLRVQRRGSTRAHAAA